MSETLFYLTVPDRCPYLPGRREQKLLTRLEAPTASEQYGRLIRLGFRRSREWAYRPRCPGCSACTPVRVPVRDFRLGRSWRRVLHRNRGLSQHRLPGAFRERHWQLFRRYLDVRHADGEMVSMQREDYRRMVEGSPLESFLLEWRDGAGRPTAVVLVDPVPEGLSAVYSFFEPSSSPDSPGTFMVLKLIELARELELAHVYLGYWIPEAPKMDYKARFRPLEALGSDGWRRIRRP